MLPLVTFRLAGLAVTQRRPCYYSPSVSGCMCIPLSFNTHAHRFTELPPHWLQHDDVTSRAIGCEAAEGRRRDAEEGREGRGERSDGARENAGSSTGGGLLYSGVSDVRASARRP